MKNYGRFNLSLRLLAVMVAALGVSTSAFAQKNAASTDVLIQTEHQDYAAIVAAIEAAGGSVTHTYKYVNGIAAKVPAGALPGIGAMPDVKAVGLDSMVHAGPQDGYNVQPLGAADINSRASADAATAASAFELDGAVELQSLGVDDLEVYYSTAVDSHNTGEVFDNGNFGQGSLIAIIDTGVYNDHFMIGGRVVGGIDLTGDTGIYAGATHGLNGFHGTHVAGIAAGAGAAGFLATDPLVEAIERYTGETLFEPVPGIKVVPLFGSAPAADLYAIKVFSALGGGSPTSRIIAGIEHAIDLKVSGAHDIDVINMSLGGGTGFEARDLQSQVVDAATAAGIAVVVSAGNDGPATQTIGRPSGAHTAITVGAAAHPVNSRVFWDLNFAFPGVGDLLYVDDNPQVFYFSSRGNTGGGSEKPDLTGVGVFVLSASSGTNNPGALAFASGTSMSSPGIAGIVALLNTASDAGGLGASPYDFKQAVMAGSTPLPGYDDFEQGAGFIDAAAAMAALNADGEYGSVQKKQAKGHTSVSRKPPGTSLQGANGTKGKTFTLNDLAPGHVRHFYFDVPPNAERIEIDVTDVELNVDPILFNSFEVHVMSGMRTVDAGYHVYTTNVWGDASFVVESQNSEASGFIFGVNTFDLPLMPGHMRVTIENDWTSFDNLSGTFNVRIIKGNNSDKPDESYSGTLGNYEVDGFFPVGFGPNGVDLALDWKNNWSRYPSSDMDLIVAWFDTDGNLFFDFSGATFNAPELVSIDATNIDAVFVLIDAFETYDQNEPWTLEVRHK